MGPSSPESGRQEQSMFDYRGWVISPNTPATSYAYNAADVMDDDSYATLLESIVSISSV